MWTVSPKAKAEHHNLNITVDSHVSGKTQRIKLAEAKYRRMLQGLTTIRITEMALDSV